MATVRCVRVHGTYYITNAPRRKPGIPIAIRIAVALVLLLVGAGFIAPLVIPLAIETTEFPHFDGLTLIGVIMIVSGCVLLATKERY